MIRILLVVIIILLSKEIFSQDYFDTRNNIKIEYLSDFIGPYNDTSYYYFEDTADRLIVSKSGYDRMEAIYFFKTDSSGLSNTHCDSIIIKYYSEILLVNHLDIILSNKNNKWIEVEPNYYVTKNKFSALFDLGKNGNGTFYDIGTLNISNQKKKNGFIELKFTIESLDREYWKKLVKK